MDVTVGRVTFSERSPLRVIAGTSMVEGFEQFHRSAQIVQELGASMVRGGAFKPRTSPYSFQGLGKVGLEIMRAVGNELQIGIVSEVRGPDDVPLVAEYADMLQIGARNMDNRALLRAAGQSGRPILLKRGIAATLDEVLAAADILVAQGNDQILLCERGTRSFEPATRNSLDIAAVPELKMRTPFPVIVDSSNGTGRSDLVTPIAMAGVAAGADGLMVDVHMDPEGTHSGGSQSLSASEFSTFMERVRAMALAVGRSVK